MTNPALRVYNPEALGAECSTCPLKGQRPVPPHEPAGQRHFTMVLEGPGKVEQGGKADGPAAGATGRFLARAFMTLGTDRRNVALRNSMCCAPLPTTTDSELFTAAEKCRPRLVRELAANVRPGEVVFLNGSYALYALTGRSNGIGNWRGYPHAALPDLPDALQKVILFPTYHPAYIMRDNPFWPIFKMDIQRALACAAGRLPLWRWPRLEVDNNDAALDLLNAMRQSADQQPIALGFDVETGGKSPFESPLLCFSLGGRGPLFDGAVSLTYPFHDEGLEHAALALMNHPNVTLELQNANHDLVTAAVNDMRITAKTHDLLPDSRVAFPQVDHDLQFTAQVFFFIELWKSLYGATSDEKGAERWLKAAAEPRTFRMMRVYNAQDGYSTAITAPPLREMLARTV